MIIRPENPKIIFFSTIVLSLYVQKHGIRTVIEEREIRRNCDDLPSSHSWRLVQEHVFSALKGILNKKRCSRTVVPKTI